MNVMAESIADALGKDDKVGKMSTRRMNGFTTEALRGFGEHRAIFAAGVDGEQLTETLMRIAVSQRHDLYRFGFRFFITERECV